MNPTAANVCKLIWTVVFQVWRAFSSYASLLFLSSAQAEVLSDLVLLFLLSSASIFLLLTKEGRILFLEAILAFLNN